MDDQAVDRAYRMGQSKDVVVSMHACCTSPLPSQHVSRPLLARLSLASLPSSPVAVVQLCHFAVI